MTTTTTGQIKANIDAASRNATIYRNLLKVAKDHNHEREIERLTEDLNEAEADLDDQITAAIEAGLTPEDLES